ncbi:MAG: 50S ribosomal protein L16 [Candidatus Diapherotrites archaeon]
MALRPGHCYRQIKDRAYTRNAVTVQDKDYIGAVPGLKVRQFNMGNGTKDFDTILDLIARPGKNGVQIRDNALESARLMINRALIKNVGKDDFFIKLRVYPSHILRENKQAQGAHADRIQKGMSHAFGKSIGRAVRVRDGQKIFSVLVMEEKKEMAKKALLLAKSRLPCKIEVVIHKDIKSIGTKPKKTRDVISEEQAAKAAQQATVVATEPTKAEAKKEEKPTEKKQETKAQQQKKA